MHRTLAVCLVIVACASSADRDRAAITKLIFDNDRMRRAWHARDATIIFRDGGAEEAVVRPDGRRIRWQTSVPTFSGG